jgi:hypothetical protein
MKRTSRIVGASTTQIAGSAIVADVGSHDQRAHHDPRIRRWCPKCDAPQGSRCIDLDSPVRRYLRSFHRGR